MSDRWCVRCRALREHVDGFCRVCFPGAGPRIAELQGEIERLEASNRRLDDIIAGLQNTIRDLEARLKGER